MNEACPNGRAQLALTWTVALFLPFVFSVGLAAQAAGQRGSVQPSRGLTFDPANPERLSLYGVTIGQNLNDIERAFPDRWKRGYSKEAGFHLYRMPNAPSGEPGIIVSAGDTVPNDGVVRSVIAFAFNPSEDYFPPAVVATTLEMAWGTAIRFRGLEHDRLWVDLTRGVQARLCYTTTPSPQLQIVLSEQRSSNP